VTVSIGLCAATGGSEPPREVLLRADEALYQAKRGGRNRVVAAGAPPK
jgi:two-component system cell cycle response regulator